MRSLQKFFFVAFVALPLAACATAGSMFDSDTQKGVVADEVAVEELLTCTEPIAVVSFIEEAGGLAAELRELGLASPLPVVRLVAQRSGCFRVVNRGAAAELIARERELRGDVDKSMVTADYIITANVLFQDPDAGGGGLGGLLSSFASSLVGGVIKSQTLEARTMLTVTSVETTLNVATVEGSARKKDIGWALGAGFAGGGSGGLGAAGSYMDTEIGRVVIAAFADAQNKLVQELDPTATRGTGHSPGN